MRTPAEQAEIAARPAPSWHNPPLTDCRCECIHLVAQHGPTGCELCPCDRVSGMTATLPPLTPAPVGPFICKHGVPAHLCDWCDDP